MLANTSYAWPLSLRLVPAKAFQIAERGQSWPQNATLAGVLSHCHCFQERIFSLIGFT
jgi:hypothetical protein